MDKTTRYLGSLTPFPAGVIACGKECRPVGAVEAAATGAPAWLVLDFPNRLGYLPLYVLEFFGSGGPIK